ncbi:TIGR01777 family protein [Dokdonia sinensis]|uniref:TIGR01777 family protein n=1 Tax=Dokdonia sinensis TaxID=2479847 RepID=A0A3M0FUH9_9FLAO|nr:TIGR01777 family oxidoreductase [Dokdonia sinensis]RMB56168.1 TIGR01777 family protein [Dokdonia sinensis]
MKVLITGATGLVGTSLTSLCHEEGITVNYLTTSQDKIKSQPNYQGYLWNPSEGELDEQCFDGVDAIIHLSGATIAQRWTDENKKIIKDSRIKSARLIFDALSRKRKNNLPIPAHIISASAIGGYPSSLTKYYDENYPDYAEGFLGEVVQEWEEVIVEFQKLDMKTARVRTGIILDKEEGALPKMMQPIKYGAGAPLGSGKQWQSWIHIDDMSRIYFHILQKGLAGVYNGVAPNPVTNEKLTKTIAETLNKSMFLPNVPEFALKLMLGDMATIVLESQKVSADKIRETGFVFDQSNISHAIAEILA